MSIYPVNFWLLCASTLLFMTGFNIIIPELNDYITSLGGADYKGLVITLFTITAGVSRPFSGKLADTIGRKPVVLVGGLVSLIISLFYPWVLSVAGFLVLRFLHGFCTGFQPTGATAMVADIIPQHRRGEAMGIFGITISVGMGVGQSLGSPIALNWGVEALFYAGALITLISVALLPGVSETLDQPKKFKFSMLALKKDEIFERSVWPAVVVMFLSVLCSGILFVAVFDLSTYLGLENKGLFMLVYLTSTLLMRFIAGKASDYYGREVVISVGLFILVIAMGVIGTSASVTQFFIGAFLFGVATGINSPTLFAWTTDLAPDDRKGKGLGSLFIALEFGIGLGAMLTIFLYNNDPGNFPRTFYFGSIISAIALVFLIVYQQKNKKNEAIT